MTDQRDESLPEKAPASVRDKAVRAAGSALLALAVVILVTSLVIPWQWAVALWIGGGLVVVVVAVVLPVRTTGLTPNPRPCASYADAVERFRSGPQAREKAGIHPTGHSRLWDHGRRTDRVAVLWHGLSNSPQSMVELGPALHAQGWTVLAPRMPEHGHEDLATKALKDIRAEALRDSADEAIDIAAGLGEHVTVLGISGGGVVAAWAGQFRTEVDRAVLVAPAFGLANFGPVVNRYLTKIMLRVPSVSIWKDPTLKADYPGLGHNYKRMHTRGVGEIGRLGIAVLRASAREAPATGTASLVLNEVDKAIDPTIARQVADAWADHIPVDRHEFPVDLGLGHEVIDPADPDGDTTVTYPILLATIRGETSGTA